MNGIAVYFSDYFGVNIDDIDEYGAINISLINDLPLFIDPFLLFNSEKEEYQEIHKEMIKYLQFLQVQSQLTNTLSAGMRQAWFKFPEVKQTWLGFSQSGNAGRGMGKTFANGVFKGLTSIFKDFSNLEITKSPHMEKLCLISPNVGRDKISDFTTNFAKKYLLEYTEKFAKKYIGENNCRMVTVNRVAFNWNTYMWQSGTYYLPYYNEDYVLLTPKDMLTRDDTFINRNDMLRKIEEIGFAIPDEALRFQLNQYFGEILKENKRPRQAELDQYAELFVRQHPELIDYYLKFKEDSQEEATSMSKENVRDVQFIFNTQITELIKLLNKTAFYQIFPDVHNEAKKRILFLKHVIEEQDGYRLFYQHDGTPIKRESDLQVIYRLVWFGTQLDVNREVNNGRGPVDYKISFGKKNATLVEFKLASNSKLKQNLEKQVEVYKAAAETDRAIKVIMFFTDMEYNKVCRILNELDLADNEDIVLIDARNNKESASNVKI